MFTLTLYTAPTDPTATAIARTLELLAVPYVRVDPTADPSAAAQLRALSGEVITPTLAFPDGTALVCPTPSQLAEHLHALLLPPSTPPPWHALLGLALAFALSVAAFALGVALSAHVRPQVASVLVLTVIALGLLGAAMTVLPPFKGWTERIRARLPWGALRWALVPAYLALLGLSVALLSEGTPAWLSRYGPPALAGIFGLLLLAALTRPLWRRWAVGLTRGQALLGAVVLLGFVGWMLAAWLGLLTTPTRPLLLAEAGVFGLLLLFGSAHVVDTWRSAHPMDGASAVLLPAFGVLMALALLSAIPA